MSSKRLNDTFFRNLLDKAVDITDSFDIDLGGLPDDVLYATSSVAPYLQTLREEMVKVILQPNVDLSSIEYGLIDMQVWADAHGEPVREALANGDVIAIDGTPLIHHQRFLTQQVYACAVGCLTSQQPMDLQAKLVKVEAGLEGVADDIEEVARIVGESEELTETASWPSTFLEYQERQLALDSSSHYVIVDGNLITQNLMTRSEGRNLFKGMFTPLLRKCYVGVMKNISRGDSDRRFFARALKSGELYVQESLYHFLKRRFEAGSYTGAVKTFAEEIGINILRGVYKPGRKAFGFECYREDLPKAIALLWLDRNSQPGFEIPFLLAHVDAQLRGRYRPNETMAAIEATLARHGEDEFFDEMDERSFR